MKMFFRNAGGHEEIMKNGTKKRILEYLTFCMTETMEVFLQMMTWRDADMFIEMNVLKNKDIIFKKREKIKENIHYKNKKNCFQLSKKNN